MTAEERLAALKRAKWRVDLKTRGGNFCRICKGASGAGKPYCRRHFYSLSGYHELMSAVSKGEQLDEADAIIQLTHLGGVLRVEKWHFRVGIFENLRRTDHNNWVLRRDDEVEVQRFNGIPEFLRWFEARREDYSARNRFATKRAIR